MAGASAPIWARYPDLEGKTAVVTGGSRGIGGATARALAANGAAVAIVARDEQALEAVASDVHSSGGRALAVRADCTVTSDLERAVDTVLAELGPPEILATFAGGNGMPAPTASDSGAPSPSGGSASPRMSPPPRPSSPPMPPRGSPGSPWTSPAARSCPSAPEWTLV